MSITLEQVLNDHSMSDKRLRQVCKKHHTTPGEIRAGFEELIQKDRHRHTDRASTVQTAIARAVEHYHLQDHEEAQRLYDKVMPRE